MNEPSDPLGMNPDLNINNDVKVEGMETEEAIAREKKTKNISDKMQQITHGLTPGPVLPCVTQGPSIGVSGSVSAPGTNSGTMLPQGTANIALGSVLSQGIAIMTPEYILSQGTAKSHCSVASGTNNLTPERPVTLGASNSAAGPVSANNLTTGLASNEISTGTNVGAAALQQMFQIKTASSTEGYYMILVPEAIKPEADASAVENPKGSILTGLLQQNLTPTLQDESNDKISKADDRVKQKTSKADAVKSKTKRLKVADEAEKKEVDVETNGSRSVRRSICTICSASFKLHSDLMAHSKIHTRANDDQLECDLCQIFFDTSDKLNEHINEFHQRDLTTKCDFCEATFFNQKNLMVHIRAHANKIGNECKDCGVYFINRKQWDAHIKLHMELYECHLCERKFAFNDDLYKHLKDHPDYLPYKCEVCTNGYKEKREWLKHMKSHKDHGPHQCEICNRTFRRKNDAYNKHMLSHAPFACHLCNESYGHINDLKQHMREEGHEYACYACNKTFLQKLTLKEHLFEQHIDALKQKYNNKASFF